MSIQRTTHEAVLAANAVADLEGAVHAQRLAALLQLRRHVDGLIAKVQTDAGNPPRMDTGD